MSRIELSIFLCLTAFVWLAVVLRRDRLSLGLPIAYLGGLLLIHVPGACVPLLSEAFTYNVDAVAIGIRLAAIGSLCFVAGVVIARFLNKRQRAIYRYVERREFWFFCLICGLFVAFGMRFLDRLPSAQAAVDRGSTIWMLGALLGLRYALSRGDLKSIATWGVLTCVYPVLTLLLAGFLSYGSAALITVAAALIVSARSRLKLVAVGTICVYLGLTLFVNYFIHRTEFRDTAWSDASMAARVDAAAEIFSKFHWFDSSNDQQLAAFDKRLNQNYFVGMAEIRIQQGQVDYLHGQSIWEGVEALVPRALWPDKPVFGGSGHIVADMTGLHLNEETSWGVGNVMEFQINFGTTGVIVGFLILGFVIGWLDIKAALAEARGDVGNLIMFFLIGVALNQGASGSIVEMCGGAAAAAVAAYLWKIIWQVYLNRSRHTSRREFATLR